MAFKCETVLQISPVIHVKRYADLSTIHATRNSFLFFLPSSLFISSFSFSPLPSIFFRPSSPFDRFDTMDTRRESRRDHYTRYQWSHRYFQSIGQFGVAEIRDGAGAAKLPCQPGFRSRPFVFSSPNQYGFSGNRRGRRDRRRRKEREIERGGGGTKPEPRKGFNQLLLC